MARFPSVPGAGAKKIGNPVYWSRMTIQNQRYRQKSENAVQKSENAVALWNERYKLIFHWYDLLWDDELEKVKDFLNQDEEDKFGDLNYAFVVMGDEINENPYLDNSQLNKLKTRLKNLILFILKMCIKYEIYDDLRTVVFDTKVKAFIINNDYDAPIFHLW